MFQIGNILIKNNIVLAPMAGISNPAYMKICEEMGVGLAFTELISAEAIVRENKKTFDMLNGIEKLKIPVGIQIFGSNAKTMANAAKIITNLYPNAFIDINMGCPVPKVAIKSGAGSALLKDPDKIYEIVKEVVNNVDVPVTVKIRSGWDSEHINALEVAKIIESAGASAITVHPRTRAQGYSGMSDWKIIKEVKQNLKIPVIGNGDVKTYKDAKKMIEETNCDAVMIGRGLLGNPWLIRECINYLQKNIEPPKVTYQEKIDMLEHHFDLLLDIKIEKLAVLEIRSNAAWYLKGIPNMIEMKNKIFKSKTKEEIKEMIKECREIINV